MALTVEQMCDTCCSSIGETAFYTLATRLLCGISRAETPAGSACYDTDPPNLDYGCAIRILGRDVDGTLNGDIRYIDADTGATVDPAAIVECPGIDCTYFTGI